MKKHIVIIGGGITGVTSAYALVQQGFEVTLIEKNRYPGMERSYANGGQLSASNAEVWTHPSTIVKGLKWMFKSDAPLLMNPTPTWHKLSWMAEFMAAMPNMLPRVGAGKKANVFYNTGHGHLGWTLSVITAHQLAGHVMAAMQDNVRSFMTPATA